MPAAECIGLMIPLLYRWEGFESLPPRDLSEKGSRPTEWPVFRPKTAKTIGLLSIKRLLARLSEKSPLHEVIGEKSYQ